MGHAMKIVYTANGKSVVLTGWRAWLALAIGLVLAWAALALLAFLLVGIAATTMAILLLVLPAAAIVAVVHGLVASRPPA
jgi:hypothetical protein